MNKDILLGFIYGISFFVVFYILTNLILPRIYLLWLVYKNNKEFSKKQKEKEEMLKKNGGMHKWIELKSPSGDNIIVCDITGWCPSRKSFLSKSAIDALKRIDELELEFENYKKEKTKEISDRFSLTPDQVLKIYEDVRNIKIVFSLEKINKVLKENINEKNRNY